MISDLKERIQYNNDSTDKQLRHSRLTKKRPVPAGQQRWVQEKSMNLQMHKSSRVLEGS